MEFVSVERRVLLLRLHKQVRRLNAVLDCILFLPVALGLIKMRQDKTRMDRVTIAQRFKKRGSFGISEKELTNAGVSAICCRDRIDEEVGAGYIK